MRSLEINSLRKQFGGLVAVNDISLHLDEGDICGLIGPNGSGKSVFFNTISGVYKNNGGQVLLGGEDITNLPAHVIVERGLGRTFQGSRTFPELTVSENVVIGQHCRTRGRILDSVVTTARGKRARAAAAEQCEQILNLMNLAVLKDTRVRDLNHVTRSLVGIAIALATRPRVLLLDEPLAGMNPSDIAVATEIISRIRELGISILIVEHHMKMIMGLCDRIVVINQGQKIAEGSAQEIGTNQEVIEAYLGRRFVTKHREA